MSQETNPETRRERDLLNWPRPCNDHVRPYHPSHPRPARKEQPAFTTRTMPSTGKGCDVDRQ